MALFTQEAVREQLRARIAIDGPTGSGKTWTALQTARILAGPDNKIAVIDTENRSAAYYAPEPGKTPERLNWFDPPYQFFHLSVSPPYDPRELAATIKAAEKELGPDDVLVIDSLSHYWEGEGGTLDQVDNAAARSGGNTFAGWKEGTPMQRHLLDAIVHAPFHVIVTMRSKMEYVLEEYVGKDGKRKSNPKKIGLAPVQRGGVEYEFTVVADMDLEHRMTISKSRSDAVADQVYTSGRSSEFGVTFSAWLKSGVEPISPEQVAVIVGRFSELPDDVRAAVKVDFVREFGKPDQLYSTSVDRALAWIDERTGSNIVDAEIIEHTGSDTIEPGIDDDETDDEIVDADIPSHEIVVAQVVDGIVDAASKSKSKK